MSIEVGFRDSFLKASKAHDTETDAAVRIVGEHQTLR
jgi:hypothetical protein